MYHDFFGWVRLILLIFLILLCSMYFIRAESQYQPEQEKEEQKKQTYLAQAETPAIHPLNAETTQEPTFSNPTEEITPQVKAATIAAEKPTEPETTYTAEDLDMLALVIYQEAGADYCSDDTRLMVGTVVMNRIADPRFPDTMQEVVTERRAYGLLHWTGAVWPTRASYPEESHAVERSYAIAKRILQGERSFDADVIFQSEYIMGEIVTFSDGMYFCR